jgi:hypothetical protein
MPLNWRVPLLVPPRYPTDFPPEQPLQERITAPLDNVLEGDSASGMVFVWEGVQGCCSERIQLSSVYGC